MGGSTNDDKSGTFITNGVQRVVVNKCIEALGYFDHDKAKVMQWKVII